MKSGNGAPRNTKITPRSNINFGGGVGPKQPNQLPWVQGKGPGAKKKKK